MRRVEIPVNEILAKLGYLKDKHPQSLFVVSAHYFKEFDTLFLNLIYKYTQEGLEGIQNQLKSQILIQNFSSSDSELRRVVKLKETERWEKHLLSSISYLADGTYSICCYLDRENYLKNDDIDLYFVGKEGNGGQVEHYDLTWIGNDLYRNESLQVFKKTGDICLAANRAHFLCIDLKNKQVLSSIQFGAKMLSRRGTKDISISLQDRDLMFSVDYTQNLSASRNSIQVVEFTPKSIRIKKQIELDKWLPTESTTIKNLIGVKEISKNGKFLLLAQVLTDDQREENQTQSLVEIEFDLEDPTGLRVTDLVEKE